MVNCTGLHGSCGFFYGRQPDHSKHLEILVPDAWRSNFPIGHERLVPAPVHKHGGGPSLRTRFRYKEVLSLKKLKKFLFAAFTVAILSCLLCQPAFAAISESDVQAQVDAVGKEAVSGNVFIWFLCAIGFLKVGQKIDSFLSSLGVNVGHTGGSMLAEAMIAARGIGGIKNFS